MKRSTCCALATLVVLACGAGNASAAGRVLVSHKRTCQMTVPSDWKVGKLLTSMADAPDKSMSAVISTSASGTDLAFAKSVVEQAYPPRQVFEDSARRLFYAYDIDGKPGFYVGVPDGHGAVCGAQISFSKGQEAQARQIADSVRPHP